MTSSARDHYTKTDGHALPSCSCFPVLFFPIRINLILNNNLIKVSVDNRARP